MRKLISIIPALAVIAYAGFSAAANIATANLTPIFTTFMGQSVAITAGTFFVGATFFLRDAVQVTSGRRVAVLAILGALALNVLLSFHYADLAWITAASAAALLLSELTDTAVFSRFGRRLGARVLLSGAASVPLDSGVFVLLGLSPLTTGIIPWAAVVPTILLQSLIKFALQLVAAVPTWGLVEVEATPTTTVLAGPVTADNPWGCRGTANG